MTRKFGSRRVGNTTIKTLDKQPVKFAHAICPLNLEEQKERFLKHGKLPKFVLKGSEDEIETLFNKARNQIRFDLFGEAEYILKTVKTKYGDGDNYLTAQFGEKITKEEATTILEQYLRENNLDGAMSIVWCADLASSARMMWIGPHCKHNRPEARSYSFWIKNSDDNNFLREQGIRCLADHEIGTHFSMNAGLSAFYLTVNCIFVNVAKLYIPFEDILEKKRKIEVRAFNDGFQPWYSNRKRFSLRASTMTTLPAIRSEEGLASLNTIMNSRVRYLWIPALHYCSNNEGCQPWFSDRKRFHLRDPGCIKALTSEEGLAAIHSIFSANFRAFNDGLQPWYSDRKRFDLRGRNSLEELRAEEGLAAINTILNSKVRFLWGPALLYYTACKAAEMTFKQLYDHLTIYVKNPEHRWRLCMRVKRGLLDPNDLGGYGKDQCYFEGAVEILRSLDDIDFNVMMSGKICVDEVQRCKRLARLDCLKLPAFMKNENRYKKHLKAIAHLNGLDLQHQRKNAPAAYIRRLKQGRRIGDKVRRIRRRRFKGFKTSSPMGSNSNDSTGSEFEDYYNESSETRDGGGEIVHYTPVIKLSDLPNKKESWLENSTFSDTYKSETAAIPDTFSLKSCDTTSIKSTGSVRSECKSSSLSVRSNKTEKSLKSEISVNSNQSAASDISEISLKTTKKKPSVSSLSEKSSNSSSHSSIVKLQESLKQSENEIQQTVAELIDKFSTNNNAQKLLGRKDILPPLITLTEDGQKSWATSRNSILRSNSQPLPLSSNHNVCTTVISSNDKELTGRRSDPIACRSSHDNVDCLTSRSETSEVTFPNVSDNHVVGFSTLTNRGVIRFKQTNQSSVFHSLSDDNVGENNSVTEQGPEKFIYPDFSIFHSNFLEIQNNFSSSGQSEHVNYSLKSQIPKRRAKSATCRQQLSSQFYAV